MAATITVDMTPTEPVMVPAQGHAGDDIRQKRADLFDKFTQTTTAAAPEPPRPAATPRERLESVVLQTPAGEIVFGPPSGVSLTMRIANIAGEENLNRVAMSLLRVLMCVQSIDGTPVRPIASHIEAQDLANRLGDSVLDFLFGVMSEEFPPPGKSELLILRKNKR